MVRKLTIEHAHEAAAKRGGKCLSTLYVDSKTKLVWECHLGHRWEADMNKIGIGRWCPDCGGRKKLTIDVAHKIAGERGGKCLSQEYIGIEELLIWQCDCGYIWNASLNNVKNKQSWCPLCAGCAKWTIKELEAIAVEKGGHLLSTEYINRSTHMEWICCQGHKWSSVASAIIQGSWCPECYGNTKWTIEELQIVAIKKGGRFLSQIYTNSQTPIEWECDQKHRWFATVGNVMHGTHPTWCPVCRKSHGERNIHDWLTQNKIEFIHDHEILGSRRRYDFYIPSTGWVIEFDGVQHFEEVPFFKKKPLAYRQQSDREKTQMAIRNGMSLLRIHYHDMDKIPELLQLVTMKAPPHIVCSRVPDYAYLGLDFTPKPEHKPKPLILVVLKQ